MIEFLKTHAFQISWGLAIFVVSLICSSIASAFVILRLPENYFDADFDTLQSDHPRWRRILGMVVKNVLGVGLVILGFIMALPGVPGQGLLTMFIGIVLLDLPGKRAIERRVISRPTILQACNRLRNRFGKKPFTISAALPNDSQ